MGNILYGDLGSEHMIYISDSKLENVVRTLYSSCETLTAGYYYTMGNGIWSYVHKYNARHAGYISAYSSAEADIPGTRFDEIKFSKKGEFECKDHKGSLSLPVNQKCKIDKNTAVNIVYQLFSDMADRKTVYLYMSDSNLSTSGSMIQGLRICNTVISAFPAVIQKYISYMSNSFPNKKNTLKVHIMFLQKNYKELYAKEWSRSFQYKVIDCSEENALPRRISKYVVYLADVISGNIEKNAELDSVFECVNCRKMEKGEIDMSIFDTIYSLYYFSRSESRDTENFKNLWLKLKETDNSCNIKKLEQLLGEEATEIIRLLNDESEPVKSPTDETELVKSCTDESELVKSSTDESETDSFNKPYEFKKSFEQPEEKSLENASEQFEEKSTETDKLELLMPKSKKSKEPKSADDKSSGENQEAVSDSCEQSKENEADTEKTAEEVKADTVKPEKKGTAEVTFKRTDCHQNEWLEFLVVFSKKIVLYRQSFGEGIEEATKIFRFNYSYTANRPGNEIVSIEIDKKMRSTIYREYENVVFFSDYRIAETFAMGLFIRYGHKTWIRNQSIAKLQLVSNSRAFASLEIDDASYIFFTSLYMYYEMHSKSNNTCGEFKDFVYETILNNFNLELGIKSKVFDIEERKNFFFGEDSCQKQYFLIYFSLCLSKLIIQCDADIYDSEIKGKEKRKRKEERVAIAEKCKIRQYIKHVFDYIEDNHNTKICYDRCVNAMELKDFSD